MPQDQAAAQADLRSTLADKLGIPARQLRNLPIASARLALENLKVLENDELTDLPLRRSGEQTLNREIARASRVKDQSKGLVLAFIDVNDLKKTNDSQGHEAGDKLITSVAGAIRSRLRPYDVAIRWGGDEFVCAVFGVDTAQAKRIFDDINHDVGQRCGGSVSVGMAQYSKGETLDGLLQRADAQLYQAKRAHHVGRDGVQ